MTQVAHFGESSAQQPSIVWDSPPRSLGHYAGLLGNRQAQIPTTLEFDDTEIFLWTALNLRFVAARPVSKLAILMRHKFGPEGREHRIAASLAALEAPQPTNLTPQQWKSIVEEVEDDDD